MSKHLLSIAYDEAGAAVVALEAMGTSIRGMFTAASTKLDSKKP